MEKEELRIASIRRQHETIIQEEIVNLQKAAKNRQWEQVAVRAALITKAAERLERGLKP